MYHALVAFQHERTPAYKEALLFAKWVNLTLRPMLKGRADLVDQINRAASSILLNIAEGAGRWGKLDKKRFYGFAKGSAGECSAILDLIETAEIASEPVENLAFERLRLDSICAQLVKLCHGVDRRGE